MKLIRRIVVFPIRMYQRFLSPLLGSNCRFHPSCSQFSIEAIERYGVIVGVIKAVARILRCHPLFPGGYDPVDTAWPRIGREKKK